MNGFLTLEILQKIKERNCPIEIIEQICKNDNDIKEYFDLTIVGQEYYNNMKLYCKREFERLRNIIVMLQDGIIDKIDDDKVNFLTVGLLLSKNFGIKMNEPSYHFFEGPFGHYKFLELMIELNYKPQYISAVLDILIDHLPDYMEDIVYPFKVNEEAKYRHPRDVERVSFEKIIENISKNDFRRMMIVMFKSQVFRGNFILGDLIKYYCKNGIFLKYSYLLPIIVEVMQEFTIPSERYNYFGEIRDFMEYDYVGLDVFEEMMDFRGIDDVDLKYHKNQVMDEVLRLKKEFERILRSPGLKDVTREGFEYKLQRIEEIGRIIEYVYGRRLKLKYFLRNRASKRIQGAWYNYITKICHPDHPKTIQRFYELENEMNKNI